MTLLKSNKLLASILFLATIVSSGFAQKSTYHIPKSIETDQVRIIFQKVSASSSSYYINYKAENIGNGILIVDRSLTSLGQNNGELYPTSDKYVLESGANKVVYNQFRVKPTIKTNADLLTLKINGLSYAKPSPPLKADKLILEEKATQTIGAFAIKVQEYNVYSDRVYANIKCSYNGSINSIGDIDLSKLEVTGGKADIVKKGDVVFSGKSYSFSINIAPNGEELSVNFDQILQVMKLQKVEIEEIAIMSTTYVAPTEEKPSKEGEKKEDENKIEELTYSDFVQLKKDIELEMNSEGKPIEMAQEFLMEKGAISTNQVLDILDVFNLDGLRLKFSKMAYAFTSDKPKYHMVVGKLSYTKNKQALEEFLERQ